MADIVIRNGHVIDPANQVNLVCDVAFKDGRISAIGTNLPKAREEVDASGCLVVPGLIDLHAHVYEHATTLGVNPDETCLARGVTTVADGGSSGAMTFQGLKKYIIEKSQTRVLAFLHIACHGLAGAGCSGPDWGKGGESDHLNAIKKDLCVKTIEENKDCIVGVKVRLDRNITDDGRIEHEVYLRAKDAAAEANVPLMVHHTNSGIPLGSSRTGVLSCPGSLSPGDIYTHTFHNMPGGIYNRKTTSIHTDVVEAKANGVNFDVGHGQGSFSWKVAEAAARTKFWPDTISSDLHTGNLQGAAKDLTYVMSKLLAVGMPLEKIIEAVTSKPAKVLGRSAEFGSLTIGREADLTMLKIVNVDNLEVEDNYRETRMLTKQIVPVGVWRAGKRFEIAKRDYDPKV